MLDESLLTDYLTSNVLPNINGILSFHDPKGNYLYLNEALETITGHKPEELLGQSFYSLVHPDDIAEVEEKSHKPVLQGEKVESIKFRFKRKDGTYHWCKSTVIPIKENDCVNKIIGYTWDIEEYQIVEDNLKIEKKIREDICRIAAIGHWSLDLNKQEVEWSDKVYEIHGLNRNHPVNFQDAMLFYEPVARKKLSAAIEECIAHCKSYDLKLPFQDANGKRKWVRAIGTAFTSRGKCKRLFGIFQDITEAVEVENQNISNIAQYLSIQNQHLIELSQIASHDLRGPATSLKMIASELKNCKEGLDKDLLLELLDEKIRLLNDKVDYISKFAGNPFKSPQIRRFDIYRCFNKVVEKNKNLLCDYDVEVIQEDGAWTELSYDWFKMNSILQNLLENACHFSDPEKENRYLIFKTIFSDKEKCIILEDNGIGMDLSKLKDNRFTRTNRLHKGLSGKGGGLFLVQTLVEGARGAICVASKPKQGTRIEINIDKYIIKDEIYET